MDTEMKQPVVILGMHRSGTTMLVDILEKLGLFMGAHYGKNKEAFFFMDRNEWLLRRSGGAWDNPFSIASIVDNETMLNRVIEMFKCDIYSIRFSRFYSKQWLPLRPDKMNSAWGWKDPRTVLTFKIWHKIFPGLKIIYITRNGVDVAVSLKTRADKNLSGGRGDILQLYPLRRRLKNLMLPHETYLLGSIRCLDIDYGFGLWEYYTSKCEEVYGLFEGEKTRLRFEDLIQQPEENIRQLALFCGLNAEKSTGIVKNLLHDRAYAFIGDPKYVSVYHKVKDSRWMRQLHYDDVL
jgi:hypothetical protein